MITASVIVALFLVFGVVYVSYNYASSSDMRKASSSCNCKTSNAIPCIQQSTFSTYDYVIVGAGAAGSVMAARLGGDCKTKVFVLEAGLDYDSLISPAITIPNTTISFSLVDTGGLYIVLWNNSIVQPAFSELNYQTAPSFWSDFQRFPYPRGTGAGGSASHHAEFMARGAPDVYDQWAAISGDSRWSGSNMWSIFKAMENDTRAGLDPTYHSTKGWLQISAQTFASVALSFPGITDFINSVVASGVPYVADFNGDPTKANGIGIYQFSVDGDGKRSNSYKDLLAPTMQSCGTGNIVVQFNSLATQVLFTDPSNPTRATGIDFIPCPAAHKASALYGLYGDCTLAPHQQVFARRRVILTGGAINTPQLLMLSGIGPKQHLLQIGITPRVDLPVGESLQDHLESFQIFRLNKTGLIHEQPLSGTSIIKYLTNRTGPLAGNLYGMWDWSFGANFTAPHKCHSHIYPYYVPRLANWDDAVNQITFDPTLQHLTFLNEVSRPQARNGRIYLASTDPTDSVFIDERLLESEADVQTMIDCILMARNATLGISSFASAYNPIELQPGPQYQTRTELEAWLRANEGYGHHMCGTARMTSNCDPTGVVDSQGRVFGVTGLYVADLSIAPVVPSGNPTLATFAIAEIISKAIIKQDKYLTICESKPGNPNPGKHNFNTSHCGNLNRSVIFNDGDNDGDNDDQPCCW